jgi:pimeloyl-[acyl-carrier protein] methyl ester esterase
MTRCAATVTAPRSALLHVESLGHGPPLVLLHGFALHGGIFAPLLPMLARTHRVHVVDLPGHGHSRNVDAKTLADVVDAVHATMPPAASAATVLGWSFGGQVALAWARRHPDAVARLVLVCTTPSFVTREDWSCAMSAETLRRFGDELRVAYRLTLQRFLTLQVQGSEAGRATLAQLRARLFERGEPDPRSLDHAMRMLVDTDLRDTAPQVRCPARVIAGTRDTLAPAAAATWLAHALTHADLRVIEGAAHVPFLSHAAAFADALQGCLDGR